MDFSPDRPSFFTNPDFRPMAGEKRTILNPATLETVGFAAAATDAEIDAVLTAATAAQAEWKRLDAKTRAKHLHAVANAIETADLSWCAELMVREMGKPYPEAIGEIANCAGVFRYYAEMARDEAGKIAETTQAGSFQFARYEPYGVSVHILPYNFPILLSAGRSPLRSPPAMPASSSRPRRRPFRRSNIDVFRSMPPGLIRFLPGGAADGTSADRPDRHSRRCTVAVAAGPRSRRRLVPSG